MATRVGTILSDENVMKHCAIYRPIPMHLTKSVLHSTQTETQYGKKLKYPSPLSRPTNFDTLATTLTRHSGNDPDIRDRLHTSFCSALTITPANVATPPTTPPSTPPSTPPATPIRPPTPPTVTRSAAASSSFSAGPANDSLAKQYEEEGAQPLEGNTLSFAEAVKIGRLETPPLNHSVSLRERLQARKQGDRKSLTLTQKQTPEPLLPVTGDLAQRHADQTVVQLA